MTSIKISRIYCTWLGLALRGFVSVWISPIVSPFIRTFGKADDNCLHETTQHNLIYVDSSKILSYWHIPTPCFFIISFKITLYFLEWLKLFFSHYSFFFCFTFLGVLHSTCVLESDFGFIVNCNFKKSSLFRVRNLGGVKAHFGLGNLYDTLLKS